MKFAEAALFRVAVSPSGKIRDGVRASDTVVQTRDSSVESGLARQRDQTNHLFATDTVSVHHEDSETSSRLGAKASGLGEKCAGNSVGWTCRTSGRQTAQDSSCGPPYSLSCGETGP